MSFQSGLPRAPDFKPSLDTEQELKSIYSAIEHPSIHPNLVQEAYNETPKQSLIFGNGIYSNTGFLLLGAVIDTVTSKPGFDGRKGYEQYTYWNVGVKGGISGPLMTSMCLDAPWRENDIKNRAAGYRENGSEFLNQVNPEGGPGGWRGPAGGWAMTIGDLARLTLGINTNHSITASNKEEMLAPNIDIPNFESRYGLCIWKHTAFKENIFLAAGDIDGYTARSTFWLEQDVGVALMCNRELAPYFAQMTNAIAALFLEGGGARP